MSKGNTFENDLLKLIFNGTAIADLAENDTTSPKTDLYVSLHTSDPGEGGSQSTNEADSGSNYLSYARVAVARNAGGWTVSGNTATNTGLVQFPASTGGSCNAQYFRVGTESSGAGKLLYSGILDNARTITSGIQPQFAATTLVVSED
jgi:hypothetical protein